MEYSTKSCDVIIYSNHNNKLVIHLWVSYNYNMDNNNNLNKEGYEGNYEWADLQESWMFMSLSSCNFYKGIRIYADAYAYADAAKLKQLEEPKKDIC